MDNVISVTIQIIENGVELTEDAIAANKAIDPAAYQRLLAVGKRIGELLQACKAIVK